MPYRSPLNALLWREPNQWQEELDDALRALSGAFLFGVPFLYTLEMWQLGARASPGLVLVLALLGVALLANPILAHFAGFKRQRRHRRAIDQALEAAAVGAVASPLILLVLNRIGPEDPPGVVLGKVIAQTLPLNLGAAVANMIFSREADRRGEKEGADSPSRQPQRPARRTQPQQPEQTPSPYSPWRDILRDVGATAVGGVFVSFAILPTEEGALLAAGLTLGHAIALLALSLVLTYAIVFATGFDPREANSPPPGPFQSPLTETTMVYAVSLLVALGGLMLFGQGSLQHPPHFVMALTLVLALPTTVGGAAGRLVI